MTESQPQSNSEREISQACRQVLCVRAPCRLHFGMFSFGHSDRPQFGGVGVMVEPPSIEVTFRPAASFQIEGAHAARVRRVVELVLDRWHVGWLPPCRLDVAAPPEHTGLGVGTQLELAVAAGLRRFVGLSPLSAVELSMQVGRGGRSAVGTHGFELGGLIVDAGKWPGDKIGRVAQRLQVPASWRFVLLRPLAARGLAGEREAAAFANLPAVAIEVTESLCRITHERMLPAAKAADCAAFGDAVYDFGRLAGDCFAAAQGGPFASVATEQLIEEIRAYGVAGVGQSSWGPTVYAVVANEDEAQALVHWVQQSQVATDFDVAIARPNNTGAAFES